MVVVVVVEEEEEDRSEYPGHNCMASCPARMYRLTPLSPEESAAVRVAALSLPSSSGELWIVMILEIEIRVSKTFQTERERERERANSPPYSWDKVVFSK